MSRGWTLVEMLIAIAVLSLLIALAIPAISHMRGHAKLTITCSRLRENGAIIHAYSADSRDYLPLPLNPKAAPYRIAVPELDIDSVFDRYFDATGYWWLPLTVGYYNRSLFDPVWYPAEADEHGKPGANTFAYPCCFTARPEYWNPLTRTTTGEQLGGNRISEVLFPAKKVLLFSDYHILMRTLECYPEGSKTRFPHGNPRKAKMPSVFVDGSASVPSYSAVAPGYPRGDGFAQTHQSDNPPACHTIDGVRGRDFH